MAIGLKKTWVRGALPFFAGAFALAVAAVWGGRSLYLAAGKGIADFYAKLGELSLQLAVVIFVGAFVKQLVEWGAAQRAHEAEKLEAKKEFLKRLRSAHVAVQNARDLLRAHSEDREMWRQQMRRLMLLRPEVEEISEDLKAAGPLFVRQGQIIEGLEPIISYLIKAGEEYVRFQDAVASGGWGRMDLRWRDDFTRGGEVYQREYETPLTQSKRTMRAEICGL